jgi:hypothetical protein
VEGPNLFIGIDPGKSGGIAAISPGISVAHKCPGTVADMTNTLSTICELGNSPIAIIEAVHSMPGQGVKSVFTFGYNYGNWIGMLAALKVPYIQVTPSKWMNHYGTTRPKDKTARKNYLKHLAQQRYPTLHTTLATADAILLAHYGLANYKHAH